MGGFRDRPVYRWGLLWRSYNLLDGERSYIMWDNGEPLLFRTRREARSYQRERYGYIAKRRDLRKEPHGWRMPLPVRVAVRITPVPVEV